MKLAKIFLLVAGAGFVGCASAPLQSEGLWHNRGSLPAVHLIQNIEFREQSAGFCGPASLSMAMQSLGKDIAPAALADQMITPGLKGTLQEDLVGAVRRQGLLGIPVRSFAALRTEINAGRPVIVFENLGLSWYPQWHYAVAVGYDFPRQEIILHSGQTPYLRENMQVFENSWKLSNYWGLVVLAPGETAASADELVHSEVAVALENSGKTAQAEKSYVGILSRWPDSLVAAIGLSHIYYNEGKLRRAAEVLQAAQRHHPQSAALSHNLAVVMKAVCRSAETARLCGELAIKK